MGAYFSALLKGAAMGVANVIPGVSGGTIALITNIFERLIHAVKSFNLRALKLLFSGKVQAFIQHTDLYFLLAVFGGVALAIVSIARLFEFLFAHYPVYIWAYFFGLILASVFFVGKTIQRWHFAVVVFLLIGSAIAMALSFMNPATENDGFIYLMLCGVAALCSMILPGLSGSFVLILMGNYQLVMIEAVNDLRLDILLPVAIGAIVGLLAFSHLLSWIFKRFRDQTIALLTGFIFGSLSILWPWKNPEYLADASGLPILKDGEKIITGYANYLPAAISTEVIIASALMLAGIISIAALELGAHKVAIEPKAE
jgi:putative membrane protein